MDRDESYNRSVAWPMAWKSTLSPKCPQVMDNCGPAPGLLLRARLNVAFPLLPTDPNPCNLPYSPRHALCLLDL